MCLKLILFQSIGEQLHDTSFSVSLLGAVCTSPTFFIIYCTFASYDDETSQAFHLQCYFNFLLCLSCSLMPRILLQCFVSFFFLRFLFFPSFIVQLCFISLFSNSMWLCYTFEKNLIYQRLIESFHLLVHSPKHTQYGTGQGQNQELGAPTGLSL